MKHKPALLAAICSVAFAVTVQAGPAVSISIGPGGCFQRQVFCPQQAVWPRPFYPVYYAPLIYCNTAPAYYYGTTVRYSNVSGLFSGGQAVIQVPPPVFPVQPVTVYQGNSFRWR